MDGSTMDMTRGKPWRLITAFAIPVLLSQVFQQLYNTADALIVGRFLGDEALAAVSSSGTLIFLIISFFTGMSMGASVTISRYFGAGDYARVSRAVHTNVLLAILCGIVLTVFGVALTPTFLRWMGTDPDVLPEAISYFRYYFFGILAVVMYNTCKGIMNALGDSRRPLYYLVISSITNIVMDIVFVGFCKMGVAGAALATIFSQAVSALLVILALLHATPALRLHWRKIRLHGDLLPRIIRIGLPAGLQSVMYSLSNLVIQSSINRFGTDMMATWTAYGKLDSFFWMIISAFGVTITTFVGQNFGAHKYDRMRKSIRTCLVMATVATLLVTGLLLTFGETLYRLFTDEEVVIQKGMQVLRLLAPFYCTYIGVEVFAGTVRGAGDSLIPMLMTLFGVCVLRVVWVTLIAPMKPDVTFMLLSYPITWSFTSILFIIYYFKGGWLERCERKAGYAHVDGRV